MGIVAVPPLFRERPWEQEQRCKDHNQLEHDDDSLVRGDAGTTEEDLHHQPGQHQTAHAEHHAGQARQGQLPPSDSHNINSPIPSTRPP